MRLTRLAVYTVLPLSLALSQTASAQVVLELTDPSLSSSPCIFTTSNGVSADPTTGRLRATGTFGENCQTTPVQPTIPSGPANWTLPTPWTIGTTATVSWSANQADLCVYDGSEIPQGQAGSWPWPASGVACNSLSSCSEAHNIALTPAVAGNYKFRLTCSRNGNTQTAVVSEISKQVDAEATGCSAPTGWTRVTQGRLRYNHASGPTLTSPTTEWRHVWGQDVNTPGVFNPWPQLANNNVGVEFGQKQFVALEFTPDRTGNFKLYLNHSTNVGVVGSGMGVSISKNCGDFVTQPGAGSATPAGCWMPNASTGTDIYFSVGTQPGFNCKLDLNQKYYLNLVYTSLPITSQSTSNCPSGSCLTAYQLTLPAQ